MFISYPHPNNLSPCAQPIQTIIARRRTSPCTTPVRQTSKTTNKMLLSGGYATSLTQTTKGACVTGSGTEPERDWTQSTRIGYDDTDRLGACGYVNKLSASEEPIRTGRIYPRTSIPPTSGSSPDREHNLSAWAEPQRTVEARSRFAPNVRLEQLAQDVLRPADLPHLRDENVCEFLRRHILR